MMTASCRFSAAFSAALAVRTEQQEVGIHAGTVKAALTVTLMQLQTPSHVCKLPAGPRLAAPLRDRAETLMRLSVDIRVSPALPKRETLMGRDAWMS